MLLQRIKKKEMNGFKDFVRSLETTPVTKRVETIESGILEDPIYMSWVLKNLMKIDHVMAFSSSDFNLILEHLNNSYTNLYKAFHQTPLENTLLETCLPPQHKIKYVDLCEMQKKTPNLSERQTAQFAIIKAIRDLQEKESVYAHPWRLPEIHVVKPNKNAFPNGHLEINFENGKLAAQGVMEKNKRHGEWEHFFSNGKLMAKGDYVKGLKNGVWSFYYGNGEKRTEGEFKDDIKFGLWKKWDRQGQETPIDYSPKK